MRAIRNLQDFIDETGVKPIAHSLGISIHTVYKWWYDDTVPEPHNARKLIKLSKGKLSYISIYEPHFAKLKGPRTKDPHQLEFNLDN